MKNQRTAAIIQARTSSSRLPDKVLLKLPYDSEISLLEQIIRRAENASSLDTIIIATTVNTKDDRIVSIAQKNKIPCFRGSEENVLERYFFCAKEYKIDLIVRLTADNVFIDGQLIDRYIHEHTDNQYDYTGTLNYPLGTNTEIFTFQALETAYNNALERNELEHVTPYIRKNPEKLFNIAYPKAEGILNRPELRLTIDTLEDYALAAVIFDELFTINPYFTLNQVIDLIDKKPWLSLINRLIQQKKPFYTLEEELEEMKKIATTQDLRRVVDFLENIMKNEY